MIRVLVDSAADFTTAELMKNNIAMVPLTVNINEKSYRDEIELPRDELYKQLLDSKNTITTSQPSPQDFADAFEKCKAAGDEVICIALSSALSGTYQSACLAKDIVDYDKIHVIDSLSATGGVQLMAYHALELIKQGISAAEIVEKLEVLKGKIGIAATVDTLKYLWLGGRVSRTTAIVADAVNVKPEITINRKGEVEVTGKHLGVGRAVKDLVKKMKKADIDYDHPVFLIYSLGVENVQKLEHALTEAGIRTNRMIRLGATLGVHVGPGAFGVIYISK